MNILDVLSSTAVKAPLDATDKRAAINELIDVLDAAKLIKNPDILKSLVWEREQQRSTGIGEGLAVPHGRSDCSEDLVIAIGRPREPIDFGSVDKKPVRLIVLIATPPDKTADHIQALGKISRLMADTEFREAAYAAETAPELYDLFHNSVHT